LATDGYTLLIRKLDKIFFSIVELIKNRTINIDAAAYILFNLYHKRNITVIGPPGSGKTTFINALDVLTPNHWRKLYLEDIVESIDVLNNPQHQIRFSIKNSQIQKPNKYSKEYQVRESLHRTPDMIYLGEMINTPSINAFFFLLKVGLRCGLSTSHGETPELMIKRWMIEDKIPNNSIKDLDLIIQLAKINDTDKIKRRIIRISEIDFDRNNLKILDIFKRNAKTDNLTNCFLDVKAIYETSPVIRKINDSGLEFLDYNEFISEINYYISILRFLSHEGISKISILNKILNRSWVLRKKFMISDWEKIENLTKIYINNILEDNYSELDNQII
jgi:type IV secretory pathway ATPase VirB11/archaellum biosynthesis ATPase